jgi:hypothetical protein
MICDAPAQPLEPPQWQIPDPNSGAPSVLLGFVSFGTQAQINRLALEAEQAGFHCGLPETDDGRVEIMVYFSDKTTRDAAFSFYKRVEVGEFGTSDTGIMVLPASALKK